MNETNNAALQLAQEVAAQHGFQLSGAELTGLAALGGAAVHIIHQAVAAWGNIGGWNGFIQFFKSGKQLPQKNT